MKLIFLLGNAGSDYVGTRHNLAWQIVSRDLEWTEKTKHPALIAQQGSGGDKVLFVRPTTFYNLVGQSLRSICDFYKILPESVLVVHDDLALPFGTLRTRIGGSDAGNNGIKSVNQHGGQATARLRLGIANDQRSLMGDTNFVLGKFSAAEQAAIAETIAPKARQIIDDFIASSHQITSHKLV